MKPQTYCLSVLLTVLACIPTVLASAQENSKSNTTQAAQAEEVLNNKTIIELKELGLGENVIVEKIKSSRCDFDVSLGGLKALKSNNVPDAVIQAMIAAKPPIPNPAVTATVATLDLDDPATPHPAGVWVLQEVNGQKKMTQLESEPVAKWSNGGYVGPYGIGKLAQTAWLSRARADLQLSDSRAVFYFYLGRSRQNRGPSTAYEFSNARSARDFALAEFTVKENQRALEVGREGAYGGSSGVDPKALREFTPEKISDGVYKITPNNILHMGEYCFCRVISVGQGEFYPFGIGSVNPTGTSTGGQDSDAAKLIAVLDGGKPQDVVHALKSLREMKAREANPAIIVLLKNSDGDVICEACRTLAVLGNKDSIPSIEPLVSGSLDFVKTEGSALSVAARIRRNNFLKEIRKEAKAAITALQSL